MRACPKRSPTRLRGVTMIEVLVTIVILTFGLLGVVALQARMQVAQLPLARKLPLSLPRQLWAACAKA